VSANWGKNCNDLYDYWRYGYPVLVRTDKLKRDGDRMAFFRLTLALMIMLVLIPMHPASAAEESYHLAAGDLIRVHVFGEDDLNMEVRLDATGVINYPFLGKVRVAGLTVDEFQNRLIRGLKNGYLVSPQVNVSIVEHRPFFIDGEVKNPGGYPYVPGLTVRKAVSLAGGFTDYAARDVFNLVRENSAIKKVVTVEADAPVGPGDSVTVEKSVFFIDGEVKKPSSYPFRSGMSLREAISLAGGLTERASENKIIIVSKDGSERSIKKNGMGTKIESGDSILVKQSFF